MVRPARALAPGQLPDELAWLDLDLLEATTPVHGWEKAGNCHGAVELGVFFPAESTPRANSADAAREVCAGCPATYDCLATALRQARNVDHGVWARTTARQRRAIRDVLYHRAKATA